MKLSSIRNFIRSWLLRHPTLNPYRLSIKRFYRMVTSHFRMLPDFIIIGAAKCGTTSLYDYLIQHPNIGTASKKEVIFFDLNYEKGILWYRSHFPTVFTKYLYRLKNKGFITGEASPGYIFHPYAPQRIFKLIPKVKLIILLRNPIDRAYSHYNQQVKNGRQTLSFEDALNVEQHLVETGEFKNILNKGNYDIYNFISLSHLVSGIYVEQIKSWMNIFPREQFLIIHTKDLEDDPDKILSQIFKFLNLSEYKIKNLERKNVGKYHVMNIKTRNSLIEYFKPYNERLYEFLGKNFDWDR